MRPQIEDEYLISQRRQHPTLSQMIGAHTCFDALASSEFCKSSRRSPTLNGYEDNMLDIAAVGLSFSPKSMLGYTEEMIASVGQKIGKELENKKAGDAV
jgi:hypothetical protein